MYVCIDVCVFLYYYKYLHDYAILYYIKYCEVSYCKMCCIRNYLLGLIYEVRLRNL